MCVCIYIYIYIQSDQKVSVHLTITVHRQVHRDFLITLYIYIHTYTTLPPSCADCLEIWEPQPPGTLRACPDL